MSPRQVPAPNKRKGPAAFFLFLVLLSSVPARAHDPGLSSVRLTLKENGLEGLGVFSRADIEPIIPIDADHDGKISAQELASAKPALLNLARRALQISYDDEVRFLESSSVAVDDKNNVEIKWVFQGVPKARLKIDSLVINELPTGHRQYLSLDRAGESLGEVILTRRDHLAEVDLPVSKAQEHSPEHRLPFVSFFRLGVEHILTGYDHLLFLFGLLLVCGNFKSILMVVTCFTLAHSLSLALATLQIVSIPARIVEPLIAASIVYVGLENFFRGRKVSFRWVITTAFGLIHGFGFASALADMAIGSGRKVILPLLAFNLGVETGQMAIAAIVVPILWRLEKRPEFVRRWIPAASLMIAFFGAIWLIQRLV